MIESGELQRLVEEDSLRGVTSNPAIFEKAILGSADYDDQVRELAEQGLDARAIYEELAIKDVQLAADVLAGVHESGRQGRLRLARGRAVAGARHRGHAEPGARPLEARRPAEPVGQDPGHRGGRARDRAGDRRGDQRQRHAALLRGGVHGDRRGVHPRHGAAQGGRRGARRPLGGQLLRLARRHRGRPAAGRAGPRGPAGHRGGGQRARRLRALQGALPRRALRRGPRGGRWCRGRCGRPPASRTRSTPRQSTSTSSWPRTP